VTRPVLTACSDGPVDVTSARLEKKLMARVAKVVTGLGSSRTVTAPALFLSVGAAMDVLRRAVRRRVDSLMLVIKGMYSKDGKKFKSRYWGSLSAS
jgi:hypothetical protein